MPSLYMANHRSGLGLLSVLAALGAAPAGHSDTAGFAKVLRTVESSVSRSDAAALGNLYADKSILFPDRFVAFFGREAVTGFCAIAFTALTLNIEFVIDPDRIVVAGNAPYPTATSSGTRFLKQFSQTVPEINRELWVSVRVEGV